MGKKKSPKKYIVDYHISMHLGYCHGPVDAFKGLWFKERPTAIPTLTSQGRFVVDDPNLFGGNDKEGGILGQVLFLPGAADQILPNDLASRFQAGATGADVPGFRHLTTLGFIGAGANGQPGMKVGSQYPQVPNPWARFSRASTTLSSAYSVISRRGWDHNNPVHVIHECLMNDDFGMGGSPAMIDFDAFANAALTVYNEGIGIGVVWTRQSKVESFIQEILDTINAMFFFNPSTGLATIKLLRDDYDPDELEIVGPDTASLISFRRKLWGETVNEIVVNWTNPETGDNETITYQDLGNIAMQGEVVSEPRQYDMICDPDMASQLGARDSVSAAQPTATAVIEVQRNQWTRLPGDVFKLSFPKEGITEVIVRVMEVDYGRPSDAKIRITLLEDIFGLGKARFVEPPASEWEEPGSIPYPVEAKIIAMPLPLSDQYFKITDAMYPRIVPGILVSEQPYDLRRFILNGEGVLTTGEPAWISDGQKATLGKALTISALVQEANTSIFTVEDIIGGLPPEVGGTAMIGDGEDWECEWIMFMEYLGANRWRIARAVFDTTPKAWPIGTPIRIFVGSFSAFDWHERVADVPLNYRLQPITSKGTLPFIDAPIQTKDFLVARPHMPFRPANVKIDGVGFGWVDYSALLGAHTPEVTITWATRNRTTEDTVYRRWDEGDVPPEDGQTTSILVLALNGVDELYRVDGIVGSSYTLDDEFFAPNEDVLIKVISQRDGLDSLQGHTIRLTVRKKGFGLDYGFGYGGWRGYEPRGPLKITLPKLKASGTGSVEE